MEIVWQAAANRGISVLNGDDLHLQVQARNLTRRHIKHLTFGRSVLNDIRIVSSTWVGSGYEHTFAHRGIIRKLNSRFISRSVAYSLAAAISAAYSSGVNFSDAIDNLQEVSPLPGRMSVLRGQKGEVILDNTRLATPQSTLELFRTTLDIPMRRKILIQGPVLREYQHGQITEETFELMNRFDVVLLYSDTSWLTYPHSLISIDTEDQLADLYSKTAQSGDLVVFNGSEGAAMWNLVKEFVVYEDIERVYNPEEDD